MLISLTLNGANLYGYIKCNFGANKDVTSAAQDFVKGTVIRNAMSNFLNPSSSKIPNARDTNMTV